MTYVYQNSLSHNNNNYIPPPLEQIQYCGLWWSGWLLKEGNHYYHIWLYFSNTKHLKGAMIKLHFLNIYLTHFLQKVHKNKALHVAALLYLRF